MDISDALIDNITDDTQKYINWLKTIEIQVDKDLLLAGPFVSPEYPSWPRLHDNFHYPLGMRKLLSLGIAGIKESAWKNCQSFEGNRKNYLILIYEVYKEISHIIEQFAASAKEKNKKSLYQSCLRLSREAPKTFLDACQLYWFSSLFRIGTATVGRIDQHLYPFLRSGNEKKIKQPAPAQKMISELLYRYEQRGSSKGDTLQNITLSGQNNEGKDQTNILTYWILEQAVKNRFIEPKINVRISRNSPQRLLNLVSELQLKGTGICTVFNDEAIIDGLKRCGRPAEVAASYCADGCSEIILDGFGETSFRYIDCVKAVEHTLFNGHENIPHKKSLQYYSNAQDAQEVSSSVSQGLNTGSFIKMRTFGDFYKAYLSQLKYQVETVLKTPYNSDRFPMRLFTAATMPRVIETGIEPYSNKNCYHTYGLFIGSLGTAVNSISAIKSLIFEKKIISREHLLAALRDNFEAQETTKRLCLEAPKFGNDDDIVDNFAVDIAKKFASWVRKHKDGIKRPILPGLYNHQFHYTAYSVGATPDGRSFGDPVGEHLSPTPGTAKKGPTSIVNSVCKVRTNENIFGSTLHLSIPLISLRGVKNPHVILQSLVRAFCIKKGCVINLTILDAEKLIEAKKYPEKYQDLVVRVWGFSYYFTRLSEELQDHIIARSLDPCAA